MCSGLPSSQRKQNKWSLDGKFWKCQIWTLQSTQRWQTPDMENRNRNELFLSCDGNLVVSVSAVPQTTHAIKLHKARDGLEATTNAARTVPYNSSCKAEHHSHSSLWQSCKLISNCKLISSAALSLPAPSTPPKAQVTNTQPQPEGWTHHTKRTWGPQLREELLYILKSILARKDVYPWTSL